MSAMIEICQVTKRFGSFTAVDRVDLKIAAGQFVTLLGPSGCGKTTLLRMLSGFETPTEGRVMIGGEDVTHLAPYRRNVNQVFQSYALFPHLTVAENIAFGLRMQKVASVEIARRVEEVIQLVALSGFEQRKPHQLSGGQRQRVALARAIVPRPQVLLLDEPLSALDAKLRQQMQLELKRLQKHLGMTFVFVTHDQEEALTMSDQIAVFNRGRIEQVGTAAEIYHHPQTPFVADFIGESNLFEAQLVERQGSRLRVTLTGGLHVWLAEERWPTEQVRALVSIRPEKVVVSKKEIQAENVFRAVVSEELFRGAMDRLHLTTSAGTALTAVVANEGVLVESVHLGDDVWCCLHPDDLIVMRAG
ncbi:MAG TPA: ABC transporter ATP-binding protein [Opitutaceae bacterium]|nr:ABC transporter ATP-binding protein [Opitutaceae bacterium]